MTLNTTSDVPDARTDARDLTAADVPPPTADRDEAKLVTQRHFCDRCAPLGGPYDLEIVVAVTVLACGALLVALGSWWLGVFLMVISGARIVGQVLRGRRTRRTERKNRQALFLDPSIRKLSIVETLHAHSTLDPGGGYSTRLGRDENKNKNKDEVTGTVELKAAWPRAHTGAVGRYRDRHKLSAREALTVHSGALLIDGPAGLTLRPSSPDLLVHPTTLMLRSTTADHDVLGTPDGRGDPRWTVAVDYQVTAPEQGWTVPVWITPALSPGSDRRSLELDVQWRMRDPADHRTTERPAPRAKEIKSLLIDVPGTWGELENASPAERITASDAHEGTRRIEWRKPEGVRSSSIGRVRLSAAFQERITADTPVTGELTMVFDGSLSGATEAHVHAAGGARRKDGPRRQKARTHVVLRFTLHLQPIGYQDVRSVPDPRRDVDDVRPEHRRFDDIVPDHLTVAQLTDLLSDEEYYVKQVVENPPQAGRQAGRTNRSWDIAGRRYIGVRPIDFRLLVTGVEIAPGASGRSSTAVRLVMKGTYATAAMEQQIVQERELLWDRIVNSLASAGEDVRVSGQPIDTAVAEVKRLRNVAISLRGEWERAVERRYVPKRIGAELMSHLDEGFGLDRALRHGHEGS